MGTAPRLRQGVVLRRAPARSTRHAELFDPLTGRAYGLDEGQALVVEAMDGRRSPAEIAAQALGDAEAGADVERLLARFRAHALIEDGLTEAAVIERQREARRQQASQERDARIVKQLRRLAATVPFHEQRLAPVIDRLRGAEDLPLLPMMTRRDVREHFKQLLPRDGSAAEALSTGAARVIVTSGSSSERLQIMATTEATLPLILNAVETEVAREQWPPRVARFTTPICSGAECNLGRMSYDERLADHVLTLNSTADVMNLGRAQLEEISAELARFQPTVLLVDPVYGVALARALQRERKPIPPVRLIWSSYEYLSILHRRVLTSVLGAPVFNDYGATELGGSGVARECERGNLHVNSRIHLEFIREGRPVEPGAVGEIIATSLADDYMVLLRYRTGDLGRPLSACDCSLGHLPAFQLEGRLKDCVLDVQGRPVTPRAVDELFTGLSWLDHYQFAQLGAGEYELLGLKSQEGSDAEAELFLGRAVKLLGEGARIRVRHVRHLAPEKSFKFRLTWSKAWTATEW